jgi:hypothetical protein
MSSVAVNRRRNRADECPLLGVEPLGPHVSRERRRLPVTGKYTQTIMEFDPSFMEIDTSA